VITNQGSHDVYYENGPSWKNYRWMNPMMLDNGNTQGTWEFTKIWKCWAMEENKLVSWLSWKRQMPTNPNPRFVHTPTS
jgi:hypothetical protein